MRAFCCWSGGKDSAMAFNKAQESGIKIEYLLNMADEDGIYSRSHGLKVDMLKKQADAIGLPLVQGKASWDGYEKEFKRVLSELKAKGITTGVFGDIDLEPHREWVERVCRESDITPVLPLWLVERTGFMDEFIERGFKAFICVVNTKHLEESWLGRELDRQFIQDMKQYPKVDLCGEGGEYHTFIYDGPMFNKEVKVSKLNHAKKDEYRFLKIGVAD